MGTPDTEAPYIDLDLGLCGHRAILADSENRNTPNFWLIIPFVTHPKNPMFLTAFSS